MRAIFDAALWRGRRERVFGGGGPLGLFHVPTGGCEGCAMEVAALRGAAFDLARHGIVFEESAGAADILLVTGALTRGMAPVLDRIWREMPSPKGLIVVGDCAIDGGPFGENYATLGGLSGRVEIAWALGGCPPEPRAILEGVVGLVRG